MKVSVLKSNITATAARFDELRDWSLLFLGNMPKRQLGLCIFPAKSIHYNAEILEANSIDVCIEILLHELAHAITFHRYNHRGHGPEFRSICSELGIPSRPYIYVRYPKSGSLYRCPNCGREDWSYSRKSRKTVYCYCGSRMYYYKN